MLAITLEQEARKFLNFADIMKDIKIALEESITLI